MKNLIQKVAAFLLCMTLLLSADCITLAAEAPADGLYSISVSTNSRMFNVTKCVLRVEDGRMYATVTMSGSGYGYLYPGTGAEADAAGKAEWSEYRVSEDDTHMFTVEVEALDKEIEWASYSIKYEKWYDRLVTLHSNTMSPYKEIAPDGIYAAAVRSKTLDVDRCILTSKDGKMTAEIVADGKKAEISVDSLDVRIPVEIGGKKHEVSIESVSLEQVKMVPEDGTYSVEVESDSSLFKVEEATLVAEDGKYTAEITVKNDKYEYVFCGTSAEALDAKAELLYPLEEGNKYTIHVGEMDREISIATYDEDKNKWYDRTLVFSSESLKTENGKPAELTMIVPEGLKNVAFDTSDDVDYSKDADAGQDTSDTPNGGIYIAVTVIVLAAVIVAALMFKKKSKGA